MRATFELENGKRAANLGSSLTGCYSTFFESAAGAAFMGALDLAIDGVQNTEHTKGGQQLRHGVDWNSFFMSTVLGALGGGLYGVGRSIGRGLDNVSVDLRNSDDIARLAAVLPNPLKYNAVAPGAYVRRRSGRIGAASGTVERLGADDCIED